jgi:hypothetical protein
MILCSSWGKCARIEVLPMIQPTRARHLSRDARHPTNIPASSSTHGNKCHPIDSSDGHSPRLPVVITVSCTLLPHLRSLLQSVCSWCGEISPFAFTFSAFTSRSVPPLPISTVPTQTCFLRHTRIYQSRNWYPTRLHILPTRQVRVRSSPIRSVLVLPTQVKATTN